jgi:hypothetical protein
MRGEKLLQGAGSISHEIAIEKATTEYKKYQQKTLSEAEKNHLESLKILENKTKKSKYANAFASTLPKPHEPTLQRFNQSFVKELAKPARVTAFQDGFRIAHAQKNKINLCFVDRLVHITNDLKIKSK